MKIISILTIPAASAGNPTQEEMERMGAYITELHERGILVDTGGRDNDMFEKIVARHDGRTTAMDGPFTEAKEVVGGYALMDVRDEAEAIELTERFLGIIGTGTCHLHEVGPAPF
ncbi:MAG: YCII-related domain protein [Candidatus Eremiobacteraeota bacterium]|nr:YCII-related domain protein [Candidatus Eremiobacteraeota bacterium]